MSEALRGLSEWINSSSIDLGGNSGNSGNSPEKPWFSRYHQNSPGGNSGNGDAAALPPLPPKESRVVTDKSAKSRDVTTVTTVTTKNDDRGSCATSVAGDVAVALAWLSPSAHTAFIASPDGTVEVRHRQPDGQWSSPLIERLPPFEPRRAAKPILAKGGAEPEPPAEWGLSRYTIRDLATWYVDEADRRRDGDVILDQAALDRDLRARLAEIGVFPEFISVEFERVMQVVFAVPTSAEREAFAAAYADYRAAQAKKSSSR